MAKDVSDRTDVRTSYQRVIEALDHFDGGRVTATSLRDAIRVHVRTVNAARGEPLDGTLAG